MKSLRYPTEPHQPDGYLYEEDRRLVEDGIKEWEASPEAASLKKTKPESYEEVMRKVKRAFQETSHAPQFSAWRKVYAEEGARGLIVEMAMAGPAKI